MPKKSLAPRIDIQGVQRRVPEPGGGQGQEAGPLGGEDAPLHRTAQEVEHLYVHTVYPRSLEAFYVVSSYIKRLKTSWTYRKKI